MFDRFADNAQGCNNVVEEQKAAHSFAFLSQARIDQLKAKMCP